MPGSALAQEKQSVKCRGFQHSITCLKQEELLANPRAQGRDSTTVPGLSGHLHAIQMTLKKEAESLEEKDPPHHTAMRHGAHRTIYLLFPDYYSPSRTALALHLPSSMVTPNPSDSLGLTDWEDLHHFQLRNAAVLCRGSPGKWAANLQIYISTLFS